MSTITLALLRLFPLACLLILGRSGASAPGVAAAGRVAPAAIDARIEAVLQGEGRAPLIIELREQVDVADAFGLTDKRTRGRLVYERLTRVAASTQPPLLDWLADRGVPAESFWIVNAVAVEADHDLLAALSLRPEVALIRLDGQMRLIDPVSVGPPLALDPWPQPAAVERGLREIGVERVWRRGFTGEGAVVGITDTGANDKHPALAGSYRGTGEGHDYNWLDAVEDKEAPLDEGGHGTHVTGTITGRHGARQIGAAPDAKWIACRLIKTRSGSDTSALKCLQWMLAPTKVDGTDPRPDLAPDVVNASWGNEPGQGCYSTVHRGPVRNLMAAGVLFVASAGNSGDACQTICVPGALLEALTVANYDVGSRRIHATSSRGPVVWSGQDYMKPDVAAPGTSINSSVPPAGYREMTGTSMAAPHVAGVVALIVSARPELAGQPEALKEVVMARGRAINPDRCGPAGNRDHNYSAGVGMILADELVSVALTATPRPSPTLSPTPSATTSPTATSTRTPTPVNSATPTPSASPEVRSDRLFVPRADKATR